MSDLLKQRCVPCEGGMLPLTISEVTKNLSQVQGWSSSTDYKKISRTFEFKEFIDSIHFVNEAARIAEEEGHHPDLHITYNKVLVELTTHAIAGLSLNDFILAAKINEIQL